MPIDVLELAALTDAGAGPLFLSPLVVANRSLGPTPAALCAGIRTVLEPHAGALDCLSRSQCGRLSLAAPAASLEKVRQPHQIRMAVVSVHMAANT